MDIEEFDEFIDTEVEHAIEQWTTASGLILDEEEKSELRDMLDDFFGESLARGRN